MTRTPRSRRKLSLALAVAALCTVTAVSFAPSAAGGPVAGRAVAGKRIVIGALLDLSAGWTTLGQASLITLRAATADANESLKRSGSADRVILRVVDAAGTAEGAEAGLRKLAAAGARVVVGPQKSSEAAATRELAGQLGVLIVSQGSTAGRLSIANDALLRVVPPDTVEVRATLAFAAADGIKRLVLVNRGDIGNEGLVDALAAASADFGIRVDSGLEYPAGASPSELAGAVSALSARVADAEEASGIGRVGVYQAGFEESASLLELAREDPYLAAVPWYAGDGSAYVGELATGAPAAASVATGYAVATLGLTPASAARAEALAERLGLETVPDAFALAAYDALRLGVRAVRATPGGALPALRRAYFKATKTYRGLTGKVALDAAGDRLSGPFDMVGICPTGAGTVPGAPVGRAAESAFRWAELAQLLPNGDTVEVDYGEEGLSLSTDCPAALGQRLVNRYFRAIQTSDRQALERILAPEFQVVRANGTVLDRDEYLANPATIGDYLLGPFFATLDGSSLVASYKVSVDSTIDGVVQPTTPAPRLSVFRLDGTNWLLSAHANFNATG